MLVLKRSDVARFSGRALAFLLVAMVCYSAVVYAVVRWSPSSYLTLTNIPGDVRIGQARLMTDDAVRAQPVDVVFLGSSHAYRSFDPRFFSRFGITSFNLGSTGQSPVQGYFLQRAYMPRLRPKLVLYELGWRSLTHSGPESGLDLVANLPLTWNLMRMVVDTREIRVYNGLLRRLLGGNSSDPQQQRASVGVHDRYVGAGFVATSSTELVGRPMQPQPFHISERSLRFVRRSVHEIRRRGAEVVFVVQPLPVETRLAILNADEVDATVAAFAADVAVPYLDFNELVHLDSEAHFSDYHHLNALGVEAFLTGLMGEFERRGLFDVLRASTETADTKALR
jgi:hypothetical protein